MQLFENNRTAVQAEFRQDLGGGSDIPVSKRINSCKVVCWDILVYAKTYPRRGEK